MSPSLRHVFPAIVLAFLLGGCDQRYEGLAAKFPYANAERRDIAAGTVSFESPAVSGNFHLGAGLLTVQLGVSDITLRPNWTFGYNPSSITIPSSEIGSCSMACFGPGEAKTELIVPAANIVIGLDNATEAAGWCWAQNIPVIARADRNKWKYQGEPLPDRKQSFAKFSSQLAYAKRIDETCHEGT